MKKFIRLHNTDDNKVMIQSVDKIRLVCIEANDANMPVTSIYIDSDDIESYTVNENPDKIFQELQALGCDTFVKLHETDDNHVCIVNTDIILFVYTEDNKTNIMCDDNTISTFTVNESPERIYGVLNPDSLSKKTESK